MALPGAAAASMAAGHINAALSGIENALARGNKLKGSFDVTFKDAHAGRAPSVSRIARNSILYFPLVVSESVPSNMLRPLVAAATSRIAEYLRMYVTNWDAVNIDKGETKQNVIDRVKGLRLENAAGELMTQADAIEIGQNLMENAARYASEALGLSGGLRPPMEAVREAQGDDEDDMFGGTRGERDPDDAEREDIHPDAAAYEKAFKDAKKRVEAIDRLINALAEMEPSNAVRFLQRLRRKFPETSADYKAMTYVMKSYEQAMKVGGEAKVGFEALKALKSNSQASAEQAKGSDAAKLNAGQPLLLKLTIKYVTAGGADSVDLLVGVKVVTHIVPAMDLVTGIGEALTKNSFLVRFLQWTTGETTFLKGFLLDLDSAKAKAIASRGAGMRLLDTFRRQARANERNGSKIWRSLTGKVTGKDGVQVPPTATVVISMGDADSIRQGYGADVSRKGAAQRFMEVHGIMGFQIVDDATQVVHTYEDGDGDFDRVPASELVAKSREGQQSDIIANVLSAVGRR